VLKSRQGSSANVWGVFAELENLVLMAHRAQVNSMVFESPLLVHTTTAQLLQRKLERTFSRHRITATVVIQPPGPMGVIRSGN
jgi:hypothetical protein